jgi:CubicO group peptidase (beta-lactamase class C family)
MDLRTTAGEEIAPYVTVTTPENQAATLRNQDQVWSVRAIRRGETVRPLPPHGRSFADLTYELGGVRFGVDDFMTRCRTAGLLVLKDGEIALERYGMGNTLESRWTSFSTAKSMTATLTGAALHDGAIASLDDPCEAHVPRLRGSAYEGVTIRNVLRMCSGVAWREDEDADGRSEVHRLGRAMVSRRPGAVLDLMCKLSRAHPQGTVFNYSTGESGVLAAVVAAAVGRPLADYFGEKVWGPAGMEADAHWQLESEGGLEMGGLGVSARLRDVGRFGLLVLDDGVAFNGQRVLPTGWRDLAGQPDCAATGFGRLRPDVPSGYGYQWWVLPHGPTGIHIGAFSAIGAHGQYIYIHPAARLVVAIHSARRQANDPADDLETFTLIGAIVRALRAAPGL